MTIDMKNSLLLTAVLFLVITIGLYVPYQRNQSVDIGIEATSTIDHLTILYTNGGFEPQSPRIPVGTTVEWINVSEKPLWVASDPHPSHTNLPGFDQKGIESSPDISLYLVPAHAHTRALTRSLKCV